MKAVDEGRKLFANFYYVDQEWTDDGGLWSGKVITHCTIYDDKNFVVSDGESLKSPLDQFSRKRGREIALGRAVWKIYPDDAKQRHTLLRAFLSSIMSRSKE